MRVVDRAYAEAAIVCANRLMVAWMVAVPSLLALAWATGVLYGIGATLLVVSFTWWISDSTRMRVSKGDQHVRFR